MKKENLQLVMQLRHELHAHPELSMQEVWTKQHLMEFLKQHTSLELVDCGRWFYAYKKGESSTANKKAFRADFDAIAIQEINQIQYSSQYDGIAHKCGHDGHSAVLCGLALELEGVKTPGDIYLIFQHAEETGQGGKECSSIIPLKGIQEVYAFHNRSGYPKHAIIYRRGLTQCASKGLTISLQGCAAHASQPEDGRNPAYAIAELITYGKKVLQENIFKEMVLCTIVHTEIGQKNFGIAASYGEVSMTLRANREEELHRFEQMVIEKADALAQADQLQIEITESDPFPETRNHEAAIARVLEAAHTLGLETIKMDEPWRASEDFGYYTKLCSGAMIYVGNGVDYPMIHTSEYDFCDDIIPGVVELFLELTKK